jgi:hypothetical protein
MSYLYHRQRRARMRCELIAVRVRRLNWPRVVMQNPVAKKRSEFFHLQKVNYYRLKGGSLETRLKVA